jgi:hypothetical protein
MTALGERDLAQGDGGLRIPDPVIAVLPGRISPNQRRGGGHQEHNAARCCRFGEAGKRAGDDIDGGPWIRLQIAGQWQRGLRWRFLSSRIRACSSINKLVDNRRRPR